MVANGEVKKTIPVLEGLWTTPSSPGEKPQLIGGKCSACGEIFFPRLPKGLCVHCQHRGLEDIKLSRRGKIWSFSVVMQRPTKFYIGADVPFAYGYVELPEGIRVESLLKSDNLEDLKVGMDVELVVEKLGDDEEGNEVMTFKFVPVKA